MLNKIKIILISAAIISFCSLAKSQAQADANIDLSQQIKHVCSDVLSPELSLNSVKMLDSFARLFSQMKRRTLYTPIDNDKTKLSLTDRFGQGKIKSVLDVATGNGAWMRLVPEQKWAADDVQVIGLELEDPDDYEKQPQSIVDKKNDWKGLDIIHDYAQFEIVNPGATLINETLIDKKGFNDLTDRLDKYDQIIKTGDWLTLANIQHAAYIRDHHFTQWLDRKKYKYEVLFPLRDHIPPDYPKSYWWNHFSNAFLSAKHFAVPYLIIAQKMPFDHNNLINQCDQSI